MQQLSEDLLELSRIVNPPEEMAFGELVRQANVKRIIEVHGGRIWVESEGRESTFCFTLPQAGREAS